MRRSTTSGVTEPARAVYRRRLGAVLGAELICAAFLVGGPQAAPSGPAVATPLPAAATASPAPRAVVMADGRTAQLIDLGAPGGASLLDRISAELPGATDAVTAFWGPEWPRDVHIVVARSPEEFAALAAGDTGIAATTTADRITFSPGVAAINVADLRTVLRHELFHYAARPVTVADAPMWLTEGVADFVGRAETALSPEWASAARSGQLPTGAELAQAGPDRSAAYDRAWSFASYVADTYGADRLRALYLEACRQGHPDIATAVRNALDAELPAVLAGWQQWHTG
ncbi:MAG: basic secretory family protein [Actinomycetia bacterium]|nr:basic secretory family protein [Actinomycetes bacterium]MCH9700699.1 basic secretory family protein [Actinomycetes bacterium]MCH9761608.1 basic secretory family protein [Actinomycetes bacterium]